MPRDLPSRSTLTVSGQATLSADPDLSLMTINLSAQAPSEGEAVLLATRRSGELRAALHEKFVDVRKLVTTAIDIQTDSGNVIAHLKLRLEGVLRQSWLDAVTTAVQAIDPTARVRLGFGLQDPAALQQRVLIKAIADARHNADALARASDLRLGEILSVDYEEAETLEEALESPTMPVPLTGGLRLENCGRMPVRFSDRLKVAWAIDR